MMNSGHKVRVRIVARLQDGTRLNIGAGRGDLMEFTLGSGQMLSGIDEFVSTLSPGDSCSVTIPADKAYGPYLPDLMQTVPVDDFPNAGALPIGQYITVRTPDGQARMKVVKVEDGLIHFDFNHELAGKDITYDIEVLADLGRSMSAVDEERLYHEHGCSCGCHQLQHSLEHSRHGAGHCCGHEAEHGAAHGASALAS